MHVACENYCSVITAVNVILSCQETVSSVHHNICTQLSSSSLRGSVSSGGSAFALTALAFFPRAALPLAAEAAAGVLVFSSCGVIVLGRAPPGCTDRKSSRHAPQGFKHR